MFLSFPSRRILILVTCKDICLCSTFNHISLQAPLYNLLNQFCSLFCANACIWITQLFWISFVACSFSLPRKLFSLNLLKATTGRLSHSYCTNNWYIFSWSVFCLCFFLIFVLLMLVLIYWWNEFLSLLKGYENGELFSVIS